MLVMLMKPVTKVVIGGSLIVLGSVNVARGVQEIRRPVYPESIILHSEVQDLYGPPEVDWSEDGIVSALPNESSIDLQ